MKTENWDIKTSHPNGLSPSVSLSPFDSQTRSSSPWPKLSLSLTPITNASTTVVFSIPEPTLSTSKSLSNPQITMAAAVVAASEPFGSSTASTPLFSPGTHLQHYVVISHSIYLTKLCLFRFVFLR